MPIHTSQRLHIRFCRLLKKNTIVHTIDDFGSYNLPMLTPPRFHDDHIEKTSQHAKTSKRERKREREREKMMFGSSGARCMMRTFRRTASMR